MPSWEEAVMSYWGKTIMSSSDQTCVVVVEIDAGFENWCLQIDSKWKEISLEKQT